MRGSLLTILVIVVAWISAEVTPARAAEPVWYDLNIESQPLSGALQEFAKQSGVQIIFFSNVTDGFEAPSLIGKFTAAAAIVRLLSGSPLTFRELDSKTIEVQAKAAVTSAAASNSEHASDQTGVHRLSAANTQVSQAPSSAAVSSPAEGGANEIKNAQERVELEEITVTGTRLRTANTASPMTVITQEDIKKQGLSTAEDIIRSLPQNFSNVNAGTVLDGSLTVDARGQSAANLRGLGAQNTLVLVNGRRRAGSSTFDGAIVNLNTIPAGAIERVEVITDGNSAIYGSDAVAGVINFILKKDYEGGETRVRQELSANDGDALSVDQLLGKSWSTGNVTASGRYSRTDGVNERKAGFTTIDFTGWGGTDHRTRTLGQPGLVRGRGALPAGDDGTSGVAGRLSQGNVVPYDSGQYSQYLTSESKNVSFDVNAEQDLGEHVRAYAEIAWSENKFDSMRGPPTVTNVVVPTTNRFNDLGAPVVVSYAFGNELLRGLIPKSQLKFTSDQKALGATLGARIALPIKDWKADVSATRSKEETFFSGTGVNETLLAQRAAGLDANGNPLPAAEHLNLFGNGAAQDPAAMAGLMDGFSHDPSTSTSTLDSALLTAEGALLSLPGGAIRLAMGGEFRSEELDYTSDPSRSSFIYLTPKPERDVKAAFAEAVIPLIGKGNRLPGAYALDLFVAARWEEYSIAGPFDGLANPDVEVAFDRTSPKFGLAWSVRPDLKLRATWSNSFRAPRLRDLFGVELGPFDFVPLIDPENPDDGLIFPAVFFTGNPELGPETSDNFTTGVDWTPAGVKGPSLSLTYSKIRFTDRIADVTNIAFTQPDLLFGLPGVIERGPDGRIARVNLMPVNIATRDSENVDLTTTYGFASPAGEITLGFSGTYAVKLEDTFIRGETPEVLDGTQNGPEKHKYRGWVSWARGHYGASLYANYSGHYTNTLPGGPQAVDGYTTYDLTAFYRFGRLGWSINGGVRNLTNKEFPFFNGSFRPWDPRRVDTRGRTFYLEIAKKYGLPGSR